MNVWSQNEKYLAHCGQELIGPASVAKPLLDSRWLFYLFAAQRGWRPCGRKALKAVPVSRRTVSVARSALSNLRVVALGDTRRIMDAAFCVTFLCVGDPLRAVLILYAAVRITFGPVGGRH